MGKMILAALLVMGTVLLSACQVRLDPGGLDVRDPVREAEATRVALAARDESAMRAIQRQAMQAEADQARVEAQAAAQAQSALVVRNWLTALGVGLGGAILCVGLATALTAWVNKKACSIYPNAAGQYPVLVKPVTGGVIVHDPNRAIGPTTIYTLPNLPGAVAERAGWPLGKVQVEAPLSAGEAAHIQIASQAQAVGLMAAVTRPQGWPVSETRNTQDTLKLAQTVVGAGAGLGHLPVVRVVDDPQKIEDFGRLLEAEGQ